MRCLGNLKWSEFNQAIKRKIKELEKNHARKAYVVWETTNPIGERFLYVRLGKKRSWQFNCNSGSL